MFLFFEVLLPFGLPRDLFIEGTEVGVVAVPVIGTVELAAEGVNGGGRYWRDGCGIGAPEPPESTGGNISAIQLMKREP